MPVSETEKRGVSSGCRFSDKPGHVPIKKRRFVLRSPSPPPAETSPCVVETADQTRSQDASNKLVPFQSSSSNISLSQIVDTTNSSGAKDSDKSNKRFCDDEDFSGISILAAAACSSSLGKDCGYAEDGSGIEESSTLERVREVSTNTETLSSSKALSKDDVIDSSEMSSGATFSCISAEPVGELASISTIVNSSQKVETVGKGLKDSFLGVVSCDNDEKIERSQRSSSRDDRLHWDLNVVMDAWEQPFDDPCAQNDLSHNISQDVGKFNHNDNLESDGHDKRDDTETVYAAQSCILPGEQRASANQSTDETKDRHGMDVGSKVEQSLCLGEKSLSSKSNPNMDVMKCVVEDTKCGRKEESVNPTVDLIVAAETTPPSALCSVNETGDASVMDLDDNRIGYQPVMEIIKSNVGVSSFQFQNLANFDAVAADTNITLCVSSNPDTVKEVNENVTVSEFIETSKNFNREGKSHVEDVNLKTVDPQEHAEYGTPGDNGLLDTEAPNSMSKRCSVDKSDAVGELQEDYDSQYEDGELRESSEFAWEEYGALDREAGNSDYVSDYRETHISNPSNYHVSVSRQVEDRKSGRQVIAPPVSSHDSIVDKEVYIEVAEAAGNEKGQSECDQLKLSHGVEKTEPSQGVEVLESHDSISELAIPGLDENGINNKMPTYSDGLLDSRSTELRSEPKAFRRGLQSQIEAPIAPDEQLKNIDNRFEAGPMRSFDRLHYSFRNQGRGRQGGNRDGSLDTRRDIRRNYSPIIHGHSKLNDDAIVEKEDLGCIGIQDDVSYSPQLHPKNRADAEGEPCVGFHSSYKHDRRFSPDRAGGFGRGRPFRHGSFGEGRGGRGRFNGPSPDEAFQSSLKYRRPLSRRERSISPFGGRGQSNLHHSRRNSPSRSRSRSPVVWNSPMRRVGSGSGGNTFLGQRSRSPSFRSEGRMQRLRSPHQQPGFGAGHAGGFRSISRNQGSPPRNRWSSARKDDQGQFMDLGYKQRGSFLDRSPGRIRFRDDRSGAIGSSRNPKPDGYYRISDRIADDDDRGRYEENFEEKRKQYHFFRPGRRNYDDGMASRLRQDNNDRFSMGNGFRDRDASSFPDSRGLRGIDSRIGDGPRRFRGENHSFVCERDGKFNHNSKQFGFDAMDSPHNLRSEEHYRPNYTGRFSAINGANRGRRYDNYGDRRKQYGPANIMRRSDNEDSEKRLRNYENVELTPEVCSRATRGVDGRTGSSSTRLREVEEPVVAGQEKKQDDCSELVSVNNSGEKDATKAVDSS